VPVGLQWVLESISYAKIFGMIDRSKLKHLVDEYGTIAVEQAVVSRFLKDHEFERSSIPSATSSSSPNEFIEMWLESISDARELANLLEVLIPEEDQKLNGAFFTPRYIVDFIVESLSPKESDRNLDPSCGCGAFLVGLVDYYQRKFGKSVRTIVQENIFGADILKYNIERTKLVLSAMALENGEFLDESDFNLFHCDSLRIDWEGTFDNIVGNPPYVKFQDLTDENREFLVRSWDTVKGGTFNLYFAFFELGFKLLNPTGQLGYITPNNYFTSLSGESLRGFFQQTKCVSRIVDFSHRKVFDAQTYTAITFLDKHANHQILYDRIKNHQSPETFLEHANGSPNSIGDMNIKKWRLLKKDEQQNIRTIETLGTPIGTLFDIAVGIATLKDDVFFVDDKEEEDGYYFKTTQSGRFRIEKSITKAVHKISEFTDQNQIPLNSRRIICPYEIKNRAAKLLTLADFEARFPACLDYFESEKDRLSSRDKGKMKYDPFFAWGRTQGLTKKGKKILTPTFSKFPRFLLVNDEDSFFTNGYGVFFKETPQSLFDDFSNPLSSEANIDVVQKILNSALMHYYVTKTSVAIDGGYPCYQKNFIERFTIPELSSNEISEIRAMTFKDEIDDFLCAKYGLSIRAILET